MKIAVYCGSDEGLEPEYMNAAAELGRWLGKAGHSLVYGGGDSGLMGMAASEARAAGCEVTGVLPGDVPFIMARPQPYVTQLIVAENMSARKQKMLELANAFIALPGGIGTLDEISEAITLTKIGVFYKKCVLFNRNGFYEPLRKMLEEMEKAGFLPSNYHHYVLFSDDVEEIGHFLEVPE